MLALTCERAQVQDGMDILDLGCGWGSLSLWLAERYPGARVTGVSNSRLHRLHIERQVALRGLTNLEIVTADANDYDPGRDVDRILSIEMFEHMRNWKELLRRMAGRLAPGGRRSSTSSATAASPTASRARRRPSGSSPAGRCPRTTCCCASRTTSWSRTAGRCPGTHYSKTLQAWLERLDANSAARAGDPRGADQPARGATATCRVAAVHDLHRGDLGLAGRRRMAGQPLPAVTPRLASDPTQLLAWTLRAKE